MPQTHLRQTLLLIPKPVLRPAVRAFPGNPVAGHAPYIFIHAFLADGKPAPACPGKRGNLPAAVAGSAFCPAAAPAAGVT